MLYSRRFSLGVAPVALFAFLFGSAKALGQKNDNATPATGAENEAPFQLKATSSLVVVRVVVRDAQGKPIENLKKEDFKLFDRGKEQSIEQFEVETSPAPSPRSTAAQGQATVLPLPMPGRFMAFYFDDLNTSDSDMILGREAADLFLTANLQPQDRVAIFTSQEMLSDFTLGMKTAGFGRMPSQPPWSIAEAKHRRERTCHESKRPPCTEFSGDLLPSAQPIPS
jgi:hypothetical protein